MNILYGKNKSISLEVPSSCLVVSNAAGSEKSIEQLTFEAVSHPLGLPGLEHCFTQDDTVAIALGEGVVHQEEIIPVLIDQLISNGIKKENITVVVFGGKNVPEDGSSGKAADSARFSGIKTHVHYTNQPQAYTIVSAMETGEPLAFVRPLVESDVVIPVGIADPVGCASPWTSRFGVFSSIYPRFSMKDAHARFANPVAFGLDAPDESHDVPEDVRDNISNRRRTAQDEYDDLEEMARIQWEEGELRRQPETPPESEPSVESPRKMSARVREALTREAKQAGWELGVVLLMEIVPGAGDAISHIVFGIPDEVEKEVCRIHADVIKGFDKGIVSGIGKLKFSRKSKHVLCALGGDESRQSWLNVIEALETVAEKSENNSNIYLCADVSQPIGPGFKVIIDGADLLGGNIASVASTLYFESFSDSLLALRWLRLAERFRIYWLSNLNPEIVEKLGAFPLNSAEELQRLIQNSAKQKNE